MREFRFVILNDDWGHILWSTESQVIALIYDSHTLEIVMIHNSLNAPFRPSKNIEKSSWRLGSTTTRTEFPVLDFAFTMLAIPAATIKSLWRENIGREDPRSSGFSGLLVTLHFHVASDALVWQQR